MTGAVRRVCHQRPDLRGLAGTTPPTRAEVESILRRILTPNPNLPASAPAPDQDTSQAQA